MGSRTGELVTEVVEHEHGRRVTVYVPPESPEAIVFAADGQWHTASLGAALEGAGEHSTMVVGVHGQPDDDGRLGEYVPEFDPDGFTAHEELFVEVVGRWVASRFGVALPAARTAVWGASLGAELALAMGLRHPDVYGVVLAASPGAGFRPPDVLASPLPRAYLVAGRQEPFFLDNATGGRTRCVPPTPTSSWRSATGSTAARSGPRSSRRWSSGPSTPDRDRGGQAHSVRTTGIRRGPMSRTAHRLRPWGAQPHGAARRGGDTMATTELQGIARFRFHDGDVEEFKRLSAQCMEIVRAKDTGTLQYDTFFNVDETECIVVERFRDSDALIQHGENLAHLMEAIIATGSVSGELLGEPSAELRSRFDPDGPVQLLAPWLRL